MFLLTFALVYPLIDAAKGDSGKMTHLLEGIPLETRDRIAGWRLDEIEPGLLSVYEEMPVVNVDGKGVRNVLACHNARFDVALVNGASQEMTNLLERISYQAAGTDLSSF